MQAALSPFLAATRPQTSRLVPAAACVWVDGAQFPFAEPQGTDLPRAARLARVFVLFTSSAAEAVNTALHPHHHTKFPARHGEPQEECAVSLGNG